MCRILVLFSVQSSGLRAYVTVLTSNTGRCMFPYASQNPKTKVEAAEKEAAEKARLPCPARGKKAFGK